MDLTYTGHPFLAARNVSRQFMLPQLLYVCPRVRVHT